MTRSKLKARKMTARFGSSALSKSLRGLATGGYISAEALSRIAESAAEVGCAYWAFRQRAILSIPKPGTFTRLREMARP